MHGGIDIAGAEGTPILSAADGTVTLAGCGDSYGCHVKMRMTSTYSTLYAHSSALFVSADQTVRNGLIITYVSARQVAQPAHIYILK